MDSGDEGSRLASSFCSKNNSLRAKRAVHLQMQKYGVSTTVELKTLMAKKEQHAAAKAAVLHS